VSSDGIYRVAMALDRSLALMQKRILHICTRTCLAPTDNATQCVVVMTYRNTVCHYDDVTQRTLCNGDDSLTDIFQSK